MNMGSAKRNRSFLCGAKAALPSARGRVSGSSAAAAAINAASWRALLHFHLNQVHSTYVRLPGNTQHIMARGSPSASHVILNWLFPS